MLCYNSQSSSIDILIKFFSNMALLIWFFPRKHLRRYAERELTHLSLGLTAQLILSEKYHHGIDDGELSLFLSLKTQSEPMDLVRFLTDRRSYEFLSINSSEPRTRGSSIIEPPTALSRWANWLPNGSRFHRLSDKVDQPCLIWYNINTRSELFIRKKCLVPSCFSRHWL